MAWGTVENRVSCSKHQVPSTTPVTPRSQPRAANDTEGGLRGIFEEFQVVKRRRNSSGHPMEPIPEPFYAFPRIEGGGARQPGLANFLTLEAAWVSAPDQRDTSHVFTVRPSKTNHDDRPGNLEQERTMLTLSMPRNT